jgi:thioredoxin reductase (NADPH)
MSQQPFEALVIGGGPAGLSAALYLARYDRQVALFDAGQGRSTWHQVNHNYLGFPGGVPARELRELGRRQLAEYAQVTVLEHKIEAIRRQGQLFAAEGQNGEWRGRTVVLCTGVIDHYPHFDGWDAYVGRSMFWCITCDGYGCKGARVVVAGNTDATAAEALQLQRFTKQLTVLTDSRTCAISRKFQDRLQRANIALIHDKIVSAIGKDGQLEAICTRAGQRIELDQLFSQHGTTPQTQLAEQLGVQLCQNGYIAADSEQKTNIPGVYAAGDVTRLHSHQVTTAVHEGGQAASAANYFLYPADLKDE